MGTWPKTTPSEEKEKQIAALHRKVREREERLEATFCEIEKFGGKVDRPADISVDVYLEFRNPADWKSGKLEALRTEILGLRQKAANLSDDFADVSRTLMVQKQLLDRPTQNQDTSKIKHTIEELEKRKAALQQERQSIGLVLEPKQKLSGRCTDFLKAHNIAVVSRMLAVIQRRAS